MRILFSCMIALCVVQLPAYAEEAPMGTPAFITFDHLTGQMALRTSQISGAWFQPAQAEQVAMLRLLSPALSEPKTVGSEAAEALWHSFEASSDFLVVSHMGGFLAIPRAQILTAWYVTEGDTPRLHLRYQGDSSIKRIDGEEATRAWASLNGD